MAISYVGGDGKSSSTNAADLVFTGLPAILADDYAFIMAHGDEAGGFPDYTLSETGWTEHSTGNPTGGQDRQYSIWSKKLTAGETIPNVANSADNEFGAAINIYRGVDPTTPLDGVAQIVNDGVDNHNPTVDPITPTTANGAFIALLGLTHTLVSTAGAPSGMTLGAVEIGSGHKSANVLMAHLLDFGAVAEQAPGAWTNNAGTVAEWVTASFILKAAAVASDTEIPVITLTGGDVTLENGETYVEQGATWTDDTDGSGAVVDIVHSIDVDTAGDYPVAYNFSDAASNAALEVVRTVTVKPILSVVTQPSNIFVDAADAEDFLDAQLSMPDALSFELVGTINPDCSFDEDTGVGSFAATEYAGGVGRPSFVSGLQLRGYPLAGKQGNPATTNAFSVRIGYDVSAVYEIEDGVFNTLTNSPLREYGSDRGGAAGEGIIGEQFATTLIDPASVTPGSDPYLADYEGTPQGGHILVRMLGNPPDGNYPFDVLYHEPSMGIAVPERVPIPYAYASAVEEIPVTELIGTALFELEGTWTASPIFTSIASGSFAEAQGASIGDWIEVEPANWSVDETGVLTMTGALPQTGQFRNMSSTSEGANQSHTRPNPAADTNPPVITLNGPAVVNRLPGGTYTDAGATAEDAIDGAVAVQVTNPVDPLVIASVAVRYNAVDSDGNQATEVLRAVNTVGLAAAQINAAGDQVELTFVGVMTAGADGASGWVAKVGGESIPLTYISGLGTSSLLFSPSRVILDDEVVALDFVQPGAGLSNPVGLMQGQTDFAVNNDSSIGAAPLLTALAVSDIGASFATLTLSTNVNNGSIAFASREGGGQLTPAQIKAATGASFRQVTQVGTQNLGNIAGLAAGTTYSVDVVHTTSQGVDSLVSSIAFSTLSAPPLQIAVIPVIPVIVGVSINPVNLAEYFDNTAVTFGIESGALLDGITLSGSVVSGVASTFTPLDVVFFAQNSAGQKTLSNVVTQAVADSLPDLFQIPHVPDVEPSVLVVSSSVVPTGYSSPTQIIATNGAEVSISGGAFVQSGTIVPGQSFRARIMASPDFLTVKTGVVSVGGRSVVFSVTTRASDALPEGFEFGYLGNAVRSAVYLSETSVVAGVDAGIDLPISIINGRYRINNGSFTTAAGLVRLGDSVQVEVTSSVEYGVTTQAQVNLVGVVSAFSVTTLRDPSIGDATPAGAVIREQVISLGVTL